MAELLPNLQEENGINFESLKRAQTFIVQHDACVWLFFVNL